MQSSLSGPITKPINIHGDTAKKKPINCGASKTTGKFSVVCFNFSSFVTCELNFSEFWFLKVISSGCRAAEAQVKAKSFKVFVIEQILICLFESLTSLNREQRAGDVMLCWTSSRPFCWKYFMTKSSWFDSQFPLCHTFHPLLSSWDNYRTLRDELNLKFGTFCQVWEIATYIWKFYLIQLQQANYFLHP